ncbi:MAG: SDR family NAD(P)-dependent oxidoreductase [Agathobacter sp.]|uniref:elongation factor P 5-aminopentanone reductase n=1 Tax=Agathobacter sp. TaxID=2021311 RepID=UPI00257C8C86|nr:SDR family NAD(P)-dependent oxidoreductase [Agathobacter sp.]MBQ1681423.1 SDR family NAD(P)-dependent oxidoreductase [Agathobacter sp.]
MKVEKVALITGASRGIGEAIAHAFANAGYALALCCRNHMEDLEQLRDTLLEQYDIPVLIYRADVADSAAVNEMVASVQAQWGQIDVLVNNAGISMVGLLQDMTDEEWNRIVQTNLSSVFYTSRAVIPSMIGRKCGQIIQISSVWGKVGASCEVAYSATKGGVNAFTRALAKELAPSHICVNAIACGAIDTQMNGHLSAEEKADLAEEIPMGFGTPEAVAEAVLRLTEMPEYLTGQVISLDGGWV